MKKIVKELAEQAEKYADDNFKGEPTYSEAYDSKFAELIVQECTKVVVNGGYRNPALGEKHQLTPPEIATMIRQHFGVEQ